MNEQLAQVGVIGMAVMGSNLARNLAHRGFRVALYNRTAARTDEVIALHGSEGDFVPSHDLADFVASLERPRRVILMVKAGGPTDATIDALIPLLEKGDIVVDGGNSFFQDTRRREQRLRVESTTTAWTGLFEEGEEITVPLKNMEGNFIAAPQELDRLEGEGLVVFRYVGWNPNGSARDIAGVRNERGNVVGLMPHPEHAVEPGFGPGSQAGPRTGTDGLGVFRSAIDSLLAV